MPHLCGNLPAPAAVELARFAVTLTEALAQEPVLQTPGKICIK